MDNQYSRAGNKQAHYASVKNPLAETQGSSRTPAPTHLSDPFAETIISHVYVSGVFFEISRMAADQTPETTASSSGISA